MHRFIALVLLLSVMPANRIDAATITNYKLSGVVTRIDLPFESQFLVGDIFSATLSLVKAPGYVSPTQSGYNVVSFSANIGSHYPLTSAGGLLTILNDWSGNLDAVKLEIPPLGPLVAGYEPEYLTVGLLYNSNDLASSDLIPQFVFNSPYESSGLRFKKDGVYQNVIYRITDFSQVPEPSTFVLAAFGAIGLLITARCTR